MKKIINVCCNNHHWIKGNICPFCKKSKTRELEVFEGDCISCGQLCPANAYGCTSPDPIFINEEN